MTMGKEPHDQTFSRRCGTTRHLGVEGLAIDGCLQLHGRRVAQRAQGEAGGFGHLDELGDALGWLVAVKRQLRLDRVAHGFRIAGQDRAGAVVSRRDCDADIFGLDVEGSCNLHKLRGESESHRNGEVAQGRGRAVRPPDALGLVTSDSEALDVSHFELVLEQDDLCHNVRSRSLGISRRRHVIRVLQHGRWKFTWVLRHRCILLSAAQQHSLAGSTQ